MENLHRLFVLDKLFHSHRYPVPVATILDHLECSLSTFKRLIQVLKDQYNYPIVYSREYRGYRYEKNQAVQISGTWFSSSELQAFLMIKNLIEPLQPGLLSQYVQPLVHYVENNLLQRQNINYQKTKRIKIIPIAHHYLRPEIFLPLCQAVLEGHRVHIEYQDIHGKITTRDISPQGLVYYKNNWYLDAWCHLRASLRTFWAASICRVERLNEPAEVIDDEIIKQAFEPSYGIFSGPARFTAHLRFSGKAALRIRNSLWHPDQIQRPQQDGCLDLELPYSDHRELLMDILRYGAEVEVLAPESLRLALKEELAKTMALYSKNLAVSS
jgi:proteasome accessory factor C